MEKEQTCLETLPLSTDKLPTRSDRARRYGILAVLVVEKYFGMMVGWALAYRDSISNILLVLTGIAIISSTANPLPILGLLFILVLWFTVGYHE